MKTIPFVLMFAWFLFFVPGASAGDVHLAPDGTYVGGNPQLAPDGTYVGGKPQLAPDGSYVGGKPQLAPDGTYVGGSQSLLLKEHTWAANRNWRQMAVTSGLRITLPAIKIRTIEKGGCYD